MNSEENNALLKQLTVLYVEDDGDTRQELALFLKRRIGRLMVATNGKEALECLEKDLPHMVITDLKMPELDGLSLVRSMRKRGYDIPVIITSALSDADTIIEAVGVGIVHYATKPLRLEELMDQIKRAGRELLKKRQDMVILGDECVLNPDQVADLEMKIKGVMAHFLKKNTGKGPRDVHASIRGNVIEIRMRGCLTRLEEGILVNGRHHSLVDYHRKVFYTENEKALVNCLRQLMACAMVLDEVLCDSQHNSEKLRFRLL